MTLIQFIIFSSITSSARGIYDYILENAGNVENPTSKQPRNVDTNKHLGGLNNDTHRETKKNADQLLTPASLDNNALAL